MERQFTEQELIRREKAEKLREAGLDPFGDRYDRDSFAADLKEKYATISHEEFENMTDTDFNAFKYDWNFLKEYPERHQSFYVWDCDSQHTLQKIEEGVADGKVSPYVSSTSSTV